MKNFIRAERTGNFAFHLQTVGKMLNLFAASGHIHYAKSARLYLQQMLQLKSKFPWVYEKFTKEGYHTVRRTDKYWNGLWSDLIIEQVLMRSLKSRGGLTRGRGVAESTRTLWVMTMHRCAEIHDAMCTLTKLQHKSSEQHVELTSSRRQRDGKDLKQFETWIDSHNPFDVNNTSLRSLSSGLTATVEDVITCDEAEKVGLTIQNKLDNLSAEEATIQRKDHARTLDMLQPGIRINDKEVKIDPLVLFCRTTTLLEREEKSNQVSSFNHELTPEPTALFRNGVMRKSTKSTLRNYILKMKHRAPSKPVADVCVIDGNAFLYKIAWVLNCSFGELANQYVRYVQRHFGDQAIHAVFDGYSDQLSCKVTEHSRRSESVVVAADVSVTPTLNVTTKRNEFLRNTNNKEQFIRLVCSKLNENGIETSVSDGDADTLIVETAINYAKTKTVIVACDDTDVLAILVHHWSDEMYNILFTTERTEQAKKTKKKDQEASQIVKIKKKPERMWWSIRTLVEKEKLASVPILLAHAFLGCDSVSGIFKMSKTKLLQLMIKDGEFGNSVNCFGKTTTTTEELKKAAVLIILKLYDGKESDSLASLRHAKFNKMVTDKAKFEPASLPPTERAIYFHALRVHLQVGIWMSLDLHLFNPLELGWKMVNGSMTPIMTDIEAAPSHLLNVVRCNCKLSSRNPCENNSKCSCRANGLKCVAACGDCRGISCCNSDRTGIEMDVDDDVSV